MTIHAVVLYALAPDLHIGGTLETFTRREDAEQFIEEVRSDDPRARGEAADRGARARGGRAELGRSSAAMRPISASTSFSSSVGDALTRDARNGGDSTDGPVRAPLLGDARTLHAFTHREGGAAKCEEERDEGDCSTQCDRRKDASSPWLSRRPGVGNAVVRRSPSPHHRLSHTHCPKGLSQSSSS